MFSSSRRRRRGSSPPQTPEERAREGRWFIALFSILVPLMALCVWQCHVEEVRRQATYESMIAAGYDRVCTRICETCTSTGACWHEPCGCTWEKAVP